MKPEEELMVLHAGRAGQLTGRLGETISHALAGRKVEYFTGSPPLENRRILFAFSLPENAMNISLYSLLAWLREHPGCLRGSVGSVVIDGAGTCTQKRRDASWFCRPAVRAARSQAVRWWRPREAWPILPCRRRMQTAPWKKRTVLR